MSWRPRRALTPALDRLEGRAVLSALTVAPARVAVVRSSPLVQPLQRSGFPIDQTVDPTSNRILNPVGTPTRHQNLRLAFGGGFNGTFQQGPGRYSEEAGVISAKAKGGTSSFLHGDMQLAVSVPTDPAIAPTGILSLFDKNRNGGNVLGLDLTAVPGAVDRLGRPTQFQFVVDHNLSGGSFAGAIGQGLVQVQYGPARRIGPGQTQGSVTVRVQGLVSASGASNQIATSSLYGS